MSKQIRILGMAAWVVAICMFTSMGLAAEGDAKARGGDRAKAKRGDAARPGGQRPGGQRPEGQRGGAPGGGSALSALAKLDLSQEQRKVIQAIQEEMHEGQQKWMKENQDKFTELREEFAAARKSGGGREALAAVMKKREELMKDRPDNKGSIKEILAVLTKDQKDKLLIALLSGQGQRGGQRGQQAGGRGGAGGGQRPGAAKRPGAEGDQPQRRRRPTPDN